MTMHKCAIQSCPLELPLSQLMCWGHWKLVPKPIQHEVYSCYQRHRGKPAHLAAIKRACKAVNNVMAGWAKARGEKPAPRPVALPYKD